MADSNWRDGGEFAGGLGIYVGSWREWGGGEFAEYFNLLGFGSGLPEAAGQRLVDYACGGMTAIDGQSHQLGLGVFLFTSGVTRVEAA